MADTTVKPEIKLDPAGASTPAMDDVEAFEETHELYIPPPPTAGGKQAWLVKVPTYLWEHWADIYRNSAEDEPIEIGKMRVKVPTSADQDPLKQKIQIRLAPGVPQHRGLPMNYDLNIKTNGYSGTVVFSEKDLPGHSRPRRQQGAKPSGIQSKEERYGNATKPGTFRTAIPKETALAPVIHHVADAAPLEDATFFKFFEKRYQLSTKPKINTIFTTGIDKGPPAGSGGFSGFEGFNTTSKGKKKVPKEKAVRIAPEALLDALDKCFRRYKYWSLKALRNELHQPEAYIKQTLENIAVLVRSGDFAMNYMLRPEYSSMNNIKDEDVKEEFVEVKSEDEEEIGTEGGEDDEDEEDEFEDVQMEG